MQLVLTDGLATHDRAYKSKGTKMKVTMAVVVFTIGAATTFGLAGPANADSPPRTGCPGGFELMDVEFVVDEYAAPGFENAIREEDRNGDGDLCIKILPPAVDFFDPTFFYQDNDFPTKRR